MAVCGDGEYTIYTALAWRNKAYGQAIGFAWSPEGEYAIQQVNGTIRIFSKNFSERTEFQPHATADKLFGGALIGVRARDSLTFYDWDQVADWLVSCQADHGVRMR